MTAVKTRTGKAPKNVVGVDIGTFSIKILQISNHGDKPSLSGIGIKNVSGLAGNEISDSLKALADKSGIISKTAAISISGPSVIVRFISLPRMDDDALKGAIRYEAEKFIPYNISDCVVDFQTLRKNEKDNNINVLLVAAKKDQVMERVKIAEKAGFDVAFVDVDEFALTNAFLRNHPGGGAEKSFALLNVGSTYTNLSILKGDCIYFARDVAVGGNDFTSVISKRIGIDEKGAEAMKVNPPKDKEAPVSDALRGVFIDLVDEIKLSFGYYENQGGKGIDELYISGGGANVVGLEQILEESIGLKPLSWDPFQFLDASSVAAKRDIIDNVKGVFNIAAGLAARQI